MKDNRKRANAIRRRIRDEGPLRSTDFDDKADRNDWGATLSRRLLRSLWWAGELAVRERKNFHPLYDLAERVIPEKARRRKVERQEATKILLLKALDGHGWATSRTLVQTWRLTKRQKLIKTCLEQLREEAVIVACSLDGSPGWIRPDDFALAARLERLRPRSDVGVLLSPFDPVLWDRDRVQTLFGFEQVLEIFKPAHQRKYGYYCMPVLAGDKLVARCDLKADRKAGRLEVVARHHEAPGSRRAVESALKRHASALRLLVR